MQMHEVVRYSLKHFIEELDLPTMEFGLRFGQTLSEIAHIQDLEMDGVFEDVACRAKFLLPACLLIHFEPALQEKDLIIDPYDLFQIVKRDMTKGEALVAVPTTEIGIQCYKRLSSYIVH